jgi:NAD(P)H-nitrite reductase large subunit
MFLGPQIICGCFNVCQALKTILKAAVTSGTDLEDQKKLSKAQQRNQSGASLIEMSDIEKT